MLVFHIPMQNILQWKYCFNNHERTLANYNSLWKIKRIKKNMHTSIKECFTSFCVGVKSEHRLGHPAWARINSQSAYVNHCRSVIIEILVTCFATFKLIVKQVFCPSAAPINKRHTATFKIKYITYENCGEMYGWNRIQSRIAIFNICFQIYLNFGSFHFTQIV